MVKGLCSFFRLLSLDVVFGACVSALFVAECLDVVLPDLVVIALAAAVWIIYTIDHLSDSFKSDATPFTPRHQFHQKHCKSLLIMLMLVMIAAIVLTTRLPSQIIFNGGILSVCVVAYFAGLKIIGSRPSVFKEPVAALVYVAGVFLGPVSLATKVDHLELLLLGAIYLFIVFVNLLIFSVYELAVDEADQHTSLVRYIGEKRTGHLITLCFIILLALWSCLVIMTGSFDRRLAVWLSMIVVLAAVNYLKKLFGVNERYRIVGDGVFYFPLIV